MKTLRITTLAIFATAAIYAQDLNQNEVPTNLLNAFQKTYSNASDVEWELDSETYKVEFDLNDLEQEIWYTKDGIIVKREMEITEKDLPSAVLSAIKSKYVGYKIDSIELIEMDNKKTYEVELEKGWTQELKVVFDVNGDVLSSVED